MAKIKKVKRLSCVKVSLSVKKKWEQISLVANEFIRSTGRKISHRCLRGSFGLNPAKEQATEQGALTETIGLIKKAR